jgi:cobalt-zinc-cadmium efflux system protein
MEKQDILLEVTHTHHSHTHHRNSGDVMLWPLLLTLGYAVVEALGGWLSGSLTLIGDAGHMFSDSAALLLAWFAGWISQRPPTQKLTYGLLRAEVIVALINSIAMIIVVVSIVWAAINRFSHPAHIHGGQVLWIAAIGLLVNILVAYHLHRAHHEDDHIGHGNMNSRAAFLHVMGDLLGSVAAIVAGGIIYVTGWYPIDAILSLVISALIMISALRLLREVIHVLMEGVPLHLEVARVEESMLKTPLVHGVHDVHIWTLSSEVVALSAHVVLRDMKDWPQVLKDLHQKLQTEFKIEHATIQPELESPQGDYPSSWLRTRHTS